MQQLPVIGHPDALGIGKHPPEVIGAHQSVIAGNGYYPPIVDRVDMPSGNTYIGCFHLVVAGLLRFSH
ncbi:hypothetical protein ES707_18484 [subsurface metagenome]